MNDLKNLLSVYHDIEFSYNDSKIYVGLCNSHKKHNSYYLKIEGKNSIEYVFQTMDELLETKIEGILIDEIIRSAMIIEAF